MKFTNFQSTNTSKGYTLIEVMIAMTLFSIITAGIVSSRIAQQSQGMSQQQAMDLQQKVRAGLSIIVREIRMAGYDPYGNTPKVGIIEAGNGESVNHPFTFTYVADDEDGDDINVVGSGDDIDNDEDGTTDEKGELKTISYFLTDLNSDGVDEFILNDDPIDPTSGETSLAETFDKLIATHVSGLSFTYLDIDNNSTTTIADIRAVKVELTTTTNVSGNIHKRTLETIVKCRNLGL